MEHSQKENDFPFLSVFQVFL